MVEVRVSLYKMRRAINDKEEELFHCNMDYKQSLGDYPFDPDKCLKLHKKIKSLEKDLTFLKQLSKELFNE